MTRSGLSYLTADSNLENISDFEYKGQRIPILLAGGLRRYFQYHIPPGGFLRSVLANDLTGALRQAESLELIELCVSFLTWHAPTQAWGSPEKVSRWLEVNLGLPFDWDTDNNEVTQ